MGLHIAFEITKWPAISQDEGHNLIKCFPLTFDSLCNFKPISTDEYNVGKKNKTSEYKMFTMYYDARGSSQEKARFTENNITSKNFNHVTYILTRLLFQCFNFMH